MYLIQGLVSLSSNTPRFKASSDQNAFVSYNDNNNNNSNNNKVFFSVPFLLRSRRPTT